MKSLIFNFVDGKGRRFADVDNALWRNGINATFKENKQTMLVGFRNQIKIVGGVWLDDSKDMEKVLQILKECGYNYCKQKAGKYIEVMYDTDKDDWGIKC